MKNLKKNGWLLLTAFASGIAALLLRRRLYAVAVDGKGLLTSNHPLSIALWGVVLISAVLITVGVRKLDGSAVYEDNFSPSSAAEAGHCFMGACILLMVLSNEFALSGIIGTVWKVLGFLSAPAMVWAGICRRKGTKPFFGIHAAVCLFLLLYVISRYQGWSGNPQLQDYVFDLMAAVALILFSYHCAAFEAGMGKRRSQLITGLLAVVLCGGALAVGTGYTGLYVGGGVWAATNLCALTPPPKKEEVESHDPA